jgi:tRNA threonylcarbamoyladenosine biosynthesis protein TsaB
MTTPSSYQQVSAPITLAIDTSSRVTSLCITRNDEILGLLNGVFDDTRSEKLWVEINNLLTGAGLEVPSVDLFGACVGPGGFTGLRVGIAASKGFAAATGKPIVGVTSLEAAAMSVRSGKALALVNAYKGEVYSQLFSIDAQRAPVAENEPLVSTFRLALERVARIEGLLLVGDAALQNAEQISKAMREIAAAASSTTPESWRIQQPVCSSAEAVARLAVLRYRAGEAGTAESVAACYVRRAEAEIKLEKGLLGSKIDRVRRQH